MSRLYIGDVLEVVLDSYNNKGYLIYLAKQIPIGFKMFGLYEVVPTVDGYNINEIRNKKIAATIMIFEDKNWKKIGRIKQNNKFAWPDQYERDFDDSSKYVIYHWGDGNEKNIIKIVDNEPDLGLAQKGSTLFAPGALQYYRNILRKLGLYNIPENNNKIQKVRDDVELDGLYGDAYYFAREILIKKDKEVSSIINRRYKEELLFPDTALQLYMGVLKAEIEENYIEKEVVDKYRLLVMQEKEYLSKEEWLNKQVKQIDEELLKLNLE